MNKPTWVNTRQTERQTWVNKPTWVKIDRQTDKHERIIQPEWILDRQTDKHEWTNQPEWIQDRQTDKHEWILDRQTDKHECTNQLTWVNLHLWHGVHCSPYSSYTPPRDGSPPSSQGSAHCCAPAAPAGLGKRCPTGHSHSQGNLDSFLDWDANKKVVKIK